MHIKKLVVFILIKIINVINGAKIEEKKLNIRIFISEAEKEGDQTEKEKIKNRNKKRPVLT